MSAPEAQTGLSLRVQAEQEIRMALEPYFPEGTPGALVQELSRVTGRLVRLVVELEKELR